MENDPTTPKLESSTLNLEEDILDAVANERSDDEESFVIAEESMITKDPMTQSKYAQVSNKWSKIAQKVARKQQKALKCL